MLAIGSSHPSRPCSINAATAVAVIDLVKEPISNTSAGWIVAPPSAFRTPATATVGAPSLLATAAAIPGTPV
jgi:hypothetical protein